MVAGMKALVKKLLGAALFVVALAGAVRADPEAFVRTVGAELSAAADVAEQDAGAGQKAVSAVLTSRFSVASLAASALPDAYRDDRSPAYVDAYRAYLARIFVRETLAAGDGEIEPIGTRQSGALTLVGANITQDGRIVRMVEFMLTPEGESYRIVNLSVEGLLVTAQQQKDFLPHLASGGIPGLIAFLTGGA